MSSSMFRFCLSFWNLILFQTLARNFFSAMDQVRHDLLNLNLSDQNQCQSQILKTTFWQLILEQVSTFLLGFGSWNQDQFLPRWKSAVLKQNENKFQKRKLALNFKKYFLNNERTCEKKKEETTSIKMTQIYCIIQLKTNIFDNKYDELIRIEKYNILLEKTLRMEKPKLEKNVNVLEFYFQKSKQESNTGCRFQKPQVKALQKNYFMRGGTEDFPYNRTQRMTRSHYKSFRNHSLNQSKQLPVTGLQIPELLIKDHAHSQEDQRVDQGSNNSTDNSPIASKRFTSAGTNRDSSSPSPTKSFSPVRIKSVLIHNSSAKKARLSIDNSSFTPNLFKLSQMFSTATTLQPKVPTVSAHSFCVMTSANRKIILGSNFDQKRQVASLTKLMTALTVFTICKRYGVDMASTLVQIEQEAAGMEGTTAGLKYADELTVINLLYGMMLPSGNDAAIALAMHFGKFLSCMYSSQELNPLASRFEHYKEYYDVHYKDNSVRLFMFEMNRIAGQIGLKQTYFQNPTGLQHQNSYSTAHDMAILSVVFSSNQTLRNITQKKVYHCEIYNQRLCTRKTTTWRNTNHLLWKRRDCKGLKTGNTPWAGPCLSAVFHVRHIEVVIILLKCSTPEQRFIDTEKLFFWFRDQYLIDGF